MDFTSASKILGSYFLNVDLRDEKESSSSRSKFNRTDEEEGAIVATKKILGSLTLPIYLPKGTHLILTTTQNISASLSSRGSSAVGLLQFPLFTVHQTTKTKNITKSRKTNTKMTKKKKEKRVATTGTNRKNRRKRQKNRKQRNSLLSRVTFISLFFLMHREIKSVGP